MNTAGQLTVLATKPDNFELLVDLGTITVPEDYRHRNCMALFRKKNHKKFCNYNRNVTDGNFSNPSHVLVPGKKYNIRAFKQIVGETTSEERLAYLKKQNAVLVGAQGLTMVFEKKSNKLPKNFHYYSFDEKDRLWEVTYDYHKVPCLAACLNGDFKLYLGDFKNSWGGHHVLLCFLDIKS